MNTLINLVYPNFYHTDNTDKNFRLFLCYSWRMDSSVLSLVFAKINKAIIELK